MKLALISILLSLIVNETSAQTSAELIIGDWVHEKDSQAHMIFDSAHCWLVHETSSERDPYSYHFPEKLLEYVDEAIEAEFLVLIMSGDTLEYEILGLNTEVLSLMAFPTGRLHLYHRKK